MNNIEFYALFLEYWDVYLYTFCLCLFVYYQTYKRVFVSFLDPLNFNVFFSFLASTVVFFLFFTNKINYYYFSSYCLTQLAFTAGFFVFRPIKINIRKIGFGNEFKIEDELLFLQFLFITASILHMLSQLYIYHLVGIPLFMYSYLDTYSEGGGIGTFSRVITASSMVSWYLLIHFFINKKSKQLRFYSWFYLIVSLVFFVLSGSKGTFLTIGLILFLYTLINSRFNLTIQNLRLKIDKFSLKLFFVVCVMVLVIITFKDNEGVNPLLQLGIRLIHSGDVYFYGYPNDVLNNITKGNGFNALFSDILGSLRIVNWELLPPSFGMMLFRYHYPEMEIIAGANARHNIFGLFYFGFIGSIIFSFSLGLILSFCRNYLFRHIYRNTLFGLFYVFLYFSTVTLETDVGLALFMFDSYLLGFILIFSLSFISYIMYKIQKPKINLIT